MILISKVFFCHIIKMYNFDPYNVLLATNIAVLLMTAFMLQGHILCKQKLLFCINRLTALVCTIN